MSLTLNGLLIFGVGVKTVLALKPLAFPMIIFPATPILSKSSPIISEKRSNAITVIWHIKQNILQFTLC